MVKANFFMVELMEAAISREIPYEWLKELVIEIIDNNSIKYNNFCVIDLSKENELHYVADVFEYKKNYLFMRISKLKPSGGFLYRDYETNEPESLLEGVNETKKGIERIYMAQEPCISQIEIEVPVPNAESLEKLFQWKDNNILDMQGKKLKAVMKVSSIDRKVITDDEEETKKVIDSIRNCLSVYNKAKIRAKSKTLKTQDYNFFDDNFSYEVHIPTYTLQDGDKHYYSAEELVGVYRQGLFEAYEESKDILKAITDR